MLPSEPLMEYVILDLLPRKRRMVCQNTLVCRKIVAIQPTTKLFLRLLLGFIYCRNCRFSCLVYRDCKSDDDLPCSHPLNASFFARIASLTSWFHQGVLFSLSPATLSRFRPQLSAADEMIADLNSSHSLSTSSDASESCLNLDDILDANCFLISLSSKASHLIR